MLRLAHVLVLAWMAAGCTRSAKTRIVCLGDSVTRGERQGVRADEAFCARIERQLRHDGLDVATVNAGVGRSTTADAVTRLDRDVLAAKPSLVLVMFGINDSWVDVGKTAPRLTVEQYRRNLQQIVERLQSQKIRVVLVTPNPVAAPMYPPALNVALARYVDAMRSVAREQHLPLVDVFAAFEAQAGGGARYQALFTDSMHPSPAGHALIADLLAPRLRELLGSTNAQSR